MYVPLLTVGVFSRSSTPNSELQLQVTVRIIGVRSFAHEPIVTRRACCALVFHSRPMPPPVRFLKGLAALAAFNTARGDEQSIAEAVDLWNEACTTTKGAEEEGKGGIDGGEKAGSVVEGDKHDAGAAVRLARASVLCSSAQGELILGRGTATGSERLGEALRIREGLLPSGHPATVRRFFGVNVGGLVCVNLFEKIP